MDNYFMQEALLEAKKALQHDEVPIGAIIVKDNEIVGRGFNFKRNSNDALAHAEMIAIKEATQTLNTWNLNQCTMYVTLEPCLMCLGALVHCRMKRLVFAASDPKSGACGGAVNLVNQPYLNHQIIIEEGVLKEKASILLTTFFKNKR